MSSLLYHWNFTGENNLVISDDESQAIYDSESNLVAKVKRRKVEGGSYSNSSISRSDDGVLLDNNDSTNGGYYIDLEGLDSVNLGGSITIEMVVKNTIHNQDSVYFQSIREFIDENGDTLDDNLGIVTSGFNSNSAYLKLFYQNSIQKTKIQVRTDSQVNATSKNGRVTYFVRNATSSNALNDILFHHYLIIVDKDGGNNNKTIQLFIDGNEAGSTTSDLQKELSDAVRQYNAIGTQKNPVNATYLNGVVKYLKIYQGAMTDSEVSDIYNNYDTAPYYDDISSGTDTEKFTRRHDTLSTYFTDNPSVTSFTMTGNQLGLTNASETYTIHKFTSGSSINISSGFHYVPLSGQNQFIIFQNGTTYYKITQTSANSNATDARYKYEISNDSGSSYGDAVTGKTFGESFTDGEITIAFGGAESNFNSAICFHKDTIIQTDQGEFLIKNLNCKNTINGKKIIYLIKSPIKPSQLVKIEPHAFGKNKPSKEILITKNHTILINNKNNPIYYYINNKSVKLVNNKDDVYNIMVYQTKNIKINGLQLGVINISIKQLNELINCIKQNKKKIKCSIKNKHKNIIDKKIFLENEKIKKFNKII